ncbi:MAG: MMPL family transporter [Comamonadaceae bacterium]|nr:MMPL family transporter [Comamonadaceae bacterium]
MPAPSRSAAAAASGSWLAAAWLIVVVAVCAHQWRFWHDGRLDADVMALLPHDERAPEVGLATEALAARASRQVVVILGAAEWDAARRAAAAWRGALQAPASPLQPRALGDAQALDAALDFYRPWREALLTPAQRERLAATPPQVLAQQSLAALYQPWRAAAVGLGGRSAGSVAAVVGRARRRRRARPRDGELWLAAEGRQWIVIGYEIDGPAFRVDGSTALADALARAEVAARAAAPSLRVLAAGVPLHAEGCAAAQASAEVNTIGWGSLAAVLLLVWAAFRSWRPIALVALSLAIGVAVALSATAAVFGQVHLLTLVFGASLVGVAEDYGIHWFATRQGHPGVAPRTLMRRLLPGMVLALVTSALAYAALAVAPFPGLRQMALFSASGLAAAFLTVVSLVPAARPCAGARQPLRRTRGREPDALAALRAFAPAGLGRRGAGDVLRRRSGAAATGRRPAPAAELAGAAGAGAARGRPSALAAEPGAVLPRPGRRRRRPAAARGGPERAAGAAGPRRPARRLERTVRLGAVVGAAARRRRAVGARGAGGARRRQRRARRGAVAPGIRRRAADAGTLAGRPGLADRSGAVAGRCAGASDQRRDAARPARRRAAAGAGRRGRRAARRALRRQGRRVRRAAGALPRRDGLAARAGARGGVRCAVAAARAPCLARVVADGAGDRPHAGGARLGRPAAATVQRAGAAAAARRRRRLRDLPCRARRRRLGLAGRRPRRGQHLARLRAARAVVHAGAARLRTDAAAGHRPRLAARPEPAPLSSEPHRTPR